MGLSAEKSPAGTAGQPPAVSVRCRANVYVPVGALSLSVETSSRKGALPVSSQLPPERSLPSQRCTPSASTAVTSARGEEPLRGLSTAVRAPVGNGSDRQSISPAAVNAEVYRPGSAGTQPAVEDRSMISVGSSVRTV